MKVRAAVLEAVGAPTPYTSSRPVGVHELDLAPPGDGELLVRVDAASLCHSDLSVVDGNRPRPVPMALGHEATGTVEHVGDGVGDLRPGDRVVFVFVPSCGRCAACAAGAPARCEPAARANGAGELLRGGHRWGALDGAQVQHHLGVSAFAERVVVDRGSVVPVDPDVPPETATLFGCALLTGVGAVLNTAEVRPGQSVAVFGLGGVGLAALLGAVVAGAHPIVAVDPVAAKRDLALELGATWALAPEDATAEAIRDLLGRGVDVGIEAVGSSAALEAAWAAGGRGSTTVAVGLAHPEQRFSVPAVQITAESRRLVGSYLGDAVPARDVPLLVAAWRAGRLPVERLRQGAVPLEDLNRALDELASGSALRQVVLPTVP